MVRFWALGDSALMFRLVFWVPEPGKVAAAQDELYTTLYKRFAEEGIEIPFPQRTVHHIGSGGQGPKS